jgi:hypothetical protein
MSKKATTHYGEKFQDHLLEQYRIYVEQLDKLSDRRVQTNIFYITILSALIGVLSLIPENSLLSSSKNFILSGVSIIGLVLCFLWHLNLRSYRQLKSAKFKVVHEMENNLPFQSFQKEWKFLGDGKKYTRLTKVEQYVPFVLAIPYLGLLILSVILQIRV